MTRYAIVKFEDGSISEVPTTWLFQENKMCWWPPSKNVSSFITKNAHPEEHWNQFKVDVERFCDTLEKARKVAEDIEYTTESDEEMGRGKRQRKPKEVFSERDEISSSDEEIFLKRTLKKAPAFHYNIPISLTEKESSILNEAFLPEQTESVHPDQPVSALKKAPALDYNIPIILTEKESPILIEAFLPAQTESVSPDQPVSDAAASTSTIHSETIDIDKYLNKIIRMLSHMELQIAEVKDMVKNNVATENAAEFEEIQKMVPIKTIQDLNKLEEYISKDENNISMVRCIRKIGGANIKDNLNRIYKLVFTNELAVQCSWLGLRNNYKISSSSLVLLVKDVISKHYPNCQDKEFDVISSEWFRHAKQRLQREKVKM